LSNFVWPCWTWDKSLGPLKVDLKWFWSLTFPLFLIQVYFNIENAKNILLIVWAPIFIPFLVSHGLTLTSNVIWSTNMDWYILFLKFISLSLLVQKLWDQFHFSPFNFYFLKMIFNIFYFIIWYFLGIFSFLVIFNSFKIVFDIQKIQKYFLNLFEWW
jgi:hypothetical protein